MLIVSAILLLAAGSATQKPYMKGEPSGVILVGQNFYYDQVEVANVHWREYLYWVNKIFGPNSEEHKRILVNKAVWSDQDTCLGKYAEYYLDAAVYNYYPVVGVSQKQAEDFAKWRSDRVMERILITHKVIPEDTAQNSETYFSIKKYFAGEYQNMKPDTAYLFYPAYRLPTVYEWMQMAHTMDSINQKRPVKNMGGYTPCAKGNKEPDPTVSVYQKIGRGPVYDLRGNVSEWSAEKDVTLGGGWHDQLSAVQSQDTFHTKAPNAWTGFRCVCEWKSYNGK